MNNGWIDKYRPNTLKKVVGHSTTKRDLAKRISSNTLNQNMLFQGVSGVGKTTIAKIITKTLVCKNPTEETFEKTKYKAPCNECPSCKSVENEDSDSALIFFDGSELNKDKLNQLRDICDSESIFSDKKIIFIDEIQNISSGKDSSMQTLLKIIEKDYKGKVFFIMSTMNINKINSAVVDRFQSKYNLKKAQIEDLIVYGGSILQEEGLLEGVDTSNLKQEGIDLFLQEGLSLIAQACNGSVRKFVNFLEECIVKETYSEKDITQEFNILSEHTTFEIMLKLVTKNKEFFKSIREIEDSLEEFFWLSYSILSDLNVYISTGYTRFNWQKGSFEKLKSKGKVETCQQLLNTYNDIFSNKGPYFNDSFFIAKLVDFFNGLLAPTKIEEPSNKEENPPRTRERKPVRQRTRG